MYNNRENAAIRIQTTWRMQRCRREYVRFRKALLVVQRNAQGFYGRLERQRRQKTLRYQARTHVKQMFELSKLCRTTDLFEESWNEDYELCRVLEILLEYRRAIRAIYLLGTTCKSSCWNTVLCMTPYRWIDCMRNFEFTDCLEDEALDAVYKKSSQYLSETLTEHSIILGAAEDESRSRLFSLDLEDFVVSIVRVCKLWCNSLTGMKSVLAAITKVGKTVNLELSFKLRVFMQTYFSTWNHRVLWHDDPVIPVAMDHLGVVKKMLGSQPHIRAVFDSWSINELRYVQKVIPVTSFINLMQKSRLIGPHFTPERAIEVFCASCSRLLDIFVVSCNGEPDPFASTTEVKQRFVMTYREFEQALVRSALSHAAIETLDFTGSVSRLGRVIDALVLAAQPKVSGNSQGSPTGDSKTKHTGSPPR